MAFNSSSTPNNNLIILIAFLTITSMVESRLLSNNFILSPSPSPTMSPLAIRLKLEVESSNCWSSLFELQACSGEIITFFLNGETYLGNGCCNAIRVVGHDCWPNVVASLGFTTQETDILEGYCVEEAVINSPPALFSDVDAKISVP